MGPMNGSCPLEFYYCIFPTEPMPTLRFKTCSGSFHPLCIFFPFLGNSAVFVAFYFWLFFLLFCYLHIDQLKKKDARWINVLLLNKSECLHWQYLHFTLTNSVKHKKRKVAKLFKKVLDVFFLWPFQRRI